MLPSPFSVYTGWSYFFICVNLYKTNLWWQRRKLNYDDIPFSSSFFLINATISFLFSSSCSNFSRYSPLLTSKWSHLFWYLHPSNHFTSSITEQFTNNSTLWLQKIDHIIIIQYNTIQKYVTRTMSVSWQNWRHGQSLPLTGGTWQGLKAAAKYCF